MDNIKLEKEPVSKKSIFLGIGFIVIYIVFNFVISIFYSIDEKYYIPSMIIVDILLIIISLLFFKKRLKRDIKALKDNFRNYSVFIFQKQSIMFGCYILLSLFSVLLTYILFGNVDVSLNQQELESMPILVITFIAIISSPFVEELLFRGSFRRFIKNDLAFIIISGLVFGLLHTITEATLLETLVRGIPYVFVGCYFAYLFVKTENITMSMISHLIHNIIALLAILIIK